VNARLEILYRSRQFSKFLSQVVERTGHGYPIGSEQDRLRNILRQELQRIENGNLVMAVANLMNIARKTQSSTILSAAAAANMKADEWEKCPDGSAICCACIEPDLPEANLLEGFVHGYFNRFGQGKNCLQAAVEQDPRLRLAWFALIEMAMAEGSNHEAARFLNEALRADPRNIQLLQISARLLLDQRLSRG